ncbi:hypothetical protein JW935_06700 [candidate division KSB1 bacterium]|nr:hypothetical protein [candidate division KSB1 bacterium]
MTDDYWEFIASYTYNPLLIMLELIWTRLEYVYNIPLSSLEEEFALESLAPLLATKCIKQKGKIGWVNGYRILSKKQLEASRVSQNWKPIIIDKILYFFLLRLCKEKSINVNDPSLIDFLDSKQVALGEFIRKIQKTGLVTIHDGNFKFLVRKCGLDILKNGNFICGDNSAQQFEKWLNNYSKNDN